MFLSIPLALLLTVAAPMDEPAGRNAAAVAPFLGEEVAVVVHLDLTRWEAQAWFHRILGKLADEDEMSVVAKAIDGSVAVLKAAGAKDMFLLFDPADMPGMPVAVVPLGDGADGKAVAAVLSRGLPLMANPLRWQASEMIRGALVAGTPSGLARIRNAQLRARPELALALASAGDPAFHVALIPSTIQRRAIEESMTVLPREIGGEPITTVTQGLRWASLTMLFNPKPTLRAVVQAKDADAAKALQKVVEGSLGLLAKESRNNPELAALATTIGQMKPQAQGDRVILEADLEKTAELVAVPIHGAREAARRAQCMKNHREIALAMHNYHSAHNTLPAAYSTNKEGKPLLSWRVHLLPFLDQNALHDEFHLDEPWDSPHNKALISRMPAVYGCPSGSRTLAGEGKTSYLTPRGPTTIFPGTEGVKIQEITDGTSNTILVVDASDAAAVIWSKPDDWEIADKFETQGLFGHHSGGTNFGFADGSVRFLKKTITPKLLQELTTRNGGEVISLIDQ